MNKQLLILIKNYLLKRGWIRVGLGFIGLGVSILIPGFWEFIIGTILLNTTEFEVSSQLNKIQIITAIVLIAVGLIVLFLVYLDEKKKKYLNVELTDQKCWILWNQEKKNSNDPEYTFEIALTIKNGIEPVRISKIKAIRFVDGTECFMRKPILYDRERKVNIDFLGDYQTLRTDLSFEPYESKKIIYRRIARAPRTGYNCEHLENGQYSLDFEYQNQHRPNSYIINKLINQNNGQLELIRELDSPPLLNNRIINDAFESGVIDKSEMDSILRIDESERYYLLRFGKEYLSRGHQLFESDLKICQSLFDKIKQTKRESQHTVE
jgi:hypothetical protein